MPTFSEVIADVKSARLAADVARQERPAPNDGGDGAYVSKDYTVTADDDTAGYADIELDLTEVYHYVVQIKTSAGALKTGDHVITKQAVNTIRVADGSTGTVAATNVITIIARGKI